MSLGRSEIPPLSKTRGCRSLAAACCQCVVWSLWCSGGRVSESGVHSQSNPYRLGIVILPIGSCRRCERAGVADWLVQRGERGGIYTSPRSLRADQTRPRETSRNVLFLSYAQRKIEQNRLRARRSQFSQPRLVISARAQWQNPQASTTKQEEQSRSSTQRSSTLTEKTEIRTPRSKEKPHSAGEPLTSLSQIGRAHV